MLEGQGRPRGGEILSLAPVRDHRSEVLARGPSHPAASLPGHFVPVRESWHALVAWKGRDSSSAEAKRERKVPASAAGSLG